MFGITAALYGEITLKNGRVEQTNFDSYQILRMNEAPAVEVHIVQSSEPPGGMGEAGTSAIVPAVANAIFAATGKRLRKMPVDSTTLKQPCERSSVAMRTCYRRNRRLLHSMKEKGRCHVDRCGKILRPLPRFWR